MRGPAITRSLISGASGAWNVSTDTGWRDRPLLLQRLVPRQCPRTVTTQGLSPASATELPTEGSGPIVRDLVPLRPPRDSRDPRDAVVVHRRHNADDSDAASSHQGDDVGRCPHHRGLGLLEPSSGSACAARPGTATDTGSRARSGSCRRGPGAVRRRVASGALTAIESEQHPDGASRAGGSAAAFQSYGPHEECGPVVFDGVRLRAAGSRGWDGGTHKRAASRLASVER
jgi:hypothetical protein